MKLLKLVVVLMFVVPMTLSAAKVKDIIKIGVVDMERLFNEYASKSKSARDLRKKKAKFHDEIKDKLKIIKKMESEFKKNSASMSDSGRRRVSAEIDFKKNQLTAMIARKNRELSAEEKKLSKPILREIYKQVQRVAKRNGFKMILESKTHVAYCDSELDLTRRVLNRLRLIIKNKRQY